MHYEEYHTDLQNELFAEALFKELTGWLLFNCLGLRLSFISNTHSCNGLIMTEMLFVSEDLKMQICIIYALYILYETQVTQPKFSIRVPYCMLFDEWMNGFSMNGLSSPHVIVLPFSS